MAQVVNLEIPGELAFIFDKMDGRHLIFIAYVETFFIKVVEIIVVYLILS